MEKKRKIQLPSLINYGIILFSLLSQTLRAKTHISLDVDQELRPSESIKKKLRIGVPRANGFEELFNMKHDSITNETIVSGYCIDVFLAAVRDLTYQIDYEFIPFIDDDGNYAGSYNDLVYQSYLQKYDAVVGDVTITANRSQYVEFTLPYTDIGVGTLAKRVDQNDRWIFLRPLDMNLWLTSLAFFIFTGFIVWVIEHPSNSDFQGSPSQQIGTVFWFIFSTLVFAHKEKLTSNSSKFVVVVWMFAVLILTSSYTATLASLLTVQQLHLQNVIYNLNYAFLGIRTYNSPEEYEDALSRGRKHGGADAIIDELPYLKLFLARYPDDYTLVKSTPTTNGFGFAFAKGSPLVSDVSKEIAKLRESGELMEIEAKWFKNKSTLVNQPDSVNNNPKTLDFQRFRGLFLITGLSSTLALIFFLFYRLYRCFIKLVKMYTFTSLGGEILPV